jgi:hypothetical protein
MRIQLNEDGTLASPTDCEEASNDERVFYGAQSFRNGIIYPTSFDDGEICVIFDCDVAPTSHSATFLRKLLDLKVVWRGEEFNYIDLEQKTWKAPNGDVPYLSSIDVFREHTYTTVCLWFARPRVD